MLHVKKFTIFINENESSDESSDERLANLARLRDLGLIEPDQYRADSMGIKRDIMLSDISKGASVANSIPEIREVINSPEAQLLKDKGLVVSSSITQLINGTIIWAKPGYTRSTGWGLGFFPGVGKIRRMTPKGLELGVFGRRLGAMDAEVKNIPTIAYTNETEFYRVAMKWAAQHIDWDQLEEADRTGDNTVWRYYVKGKTKQGYFNDENNRII